MTLQEYRRKYEMTYTDLADLLGYSLSTVHGWITTDRKPDIEAIPQIVSRTNGEVTAADLRPDVAALFVPAEARLAL